MVKPEHMLLGLGAIGAGIFLLSRRDGGVSVKMPEMGISMPSIEMPSIGLEILGGLKMPSLEGVQGAFASLGESLKQAFSGIKMPDITIPDITIPDWPKIPTAGEITTNIKQIVPEWVYDPLGYTGEKVGGAIVSIKDDVVDLLREQYAKIPVIGKIWEVPKVKKYEYEPYISKVTQPIANYIQGGIGGISRTTTGLLEPMR